MFPRRRADSLAKWPAPDPPTVNRMKQASRLPEISKALLTWYRRCRRDLPWRRRRDPYAIWISEIMLQQTQVTTIAARYDEFLERFPDVHALAGASLGAVLKAWEGLGYYARARNLHRAAKQIVRQHDGKLPRGLEALLRLPGVGRYTAGAIASIAFDLDEPVLDGNVTRVCCRLFRVRRNPKAAKTQETLWRFARGLIPPGRAGLLNQALMDLGATVCTAREPRCLLCPVATFCEALAHGEQHTLPMKVKAKPIPHYDVAAGVIRKGGRLLIDQRKPEGLLGGLWEFPGGKREKGESLKACLAREVREELSIAIKVLRPLVTAKHAYSHFRITLHAFECEYVSGSPRALGCAAFKWVWPSGLGRYAFPRGSQKIIAALTKAD